MQIGLTFHFCYRLTEQTPRHQQLTKAIRVILLPLMVMLKSQLRKVSGVEVVFFSMETIIYLLQIMLIGLLEQETLR